MNNSNRTHEALLAEIASLKNQLKQTEETLRAENRYDRGLIDDCPDPLVILDLEGRITDINKTASEVTGYSRDDLIGTDFSDHFMEPEKVRAGCRQVLQKSQAGDDLLGFKHRDGRERVMFCRWSAYRDGMGQAAGVVVVACDVTQRRQATIQSAKEYNRRLIEVSPDPLVTIGPDGRITDVNHATETATGYSREDLIGTDFSDYFTEPEKARAGYRQVFQEGQVRDYPLEIKHRDGHVTPVLDNASVYRDEAGQAAGVFAAARDITELKRAEAALIHARDRERFLLNQLKNAMRDGFLLVNLDGTVLELNRNAAALLHVSRPEVTGTPLRSLCGRDKESLVILVEELMQTGLFVQDQEISGGDPGAKWYYSLDLLPLADDGMTSALVIIHDVSRLRELEYEVSG